VLTGLLLGLSAAAAWGLSDLTAALGARLVGSLRVLVISQLVSLVLLVVVLALDPARLGPDPAPGLASGLALGLVAGTAYLSMYTALRIGPISVVSPVVAAYGGLTVVLAILLRGESLAPHQGIGAALSTVGVILIALVLNIRLRARLVGPGVLLGLLTLVLFAVVTVALAAPIQAHGWLSVALGSRLSNSSLAVAILAVATLRRPVVLDPILQPAGSLSRRALGLAVLAGVFDFAGFTAYAVGLEVSFTWLIGLASSFGPAIVVLYALGRLGERLRPNQWLGLALLAAGVVTLALPS
jgi:uncharacterized membrane protein